MQTKWHWILILFLITLFSSTVQSQTPPAAIDEVTVVISRDVTTMDPQVDWTLDARNIWYNISGYLALHDRNMELRGELAESWEWIDDRTVRFHLREGVRFHNGEPFDANAVKFSIDRILYDEEAGSPWKSVISFVEEVIVVDDFTVDVRATGPVPTLAAQVGRMVIVPPGYITEFGNAHFAANPIGTGPFKFVEWVPGQRVVLERNTDYWRGPANIERVVFRAIPETFTRITELLTGRADIVVQVPEESVDQIEASADSRVVTVPSMQTVYLGLSAQHEPLNDPMVRQAIGHAINVQGIVDFIMGGYAQPTAGVLNSFIWGADPNVERPEYDPELAMSLLAEAGYAPGEIDIPLTFGTGRFIKDREVAEAISADLEAVGITATVTPMEWGVWQENYYADSLEGLFLMSWTATIGDPDDIFKFVESGRTGFTYFSSAALDDVIAKQLVTPEPADRLPIVQEAQQLIREHMALIALYDIETTYGVSNRIEWLPQPNDFILLHGVTPR